MPEQLDLIAEPSAEYQPDDREKPTDDERSTYRERLRHYLKDPDSRTLEGFPLGEDDAILALSDPPYYTACPNPFLPEILEQWEAERETSSGERKTSEEYHREPFAADVSEGKHHAIYRAHSYHTKVPHKAIMRYILHYTDPGDIVFDGFCGTGMTGVAAQLCGDREAVQDLGYVVDADGGIHADTDSDAAFSQLGARKAVLVDLSPAATFIAYNYNTPVDAQAFRREARRILREVEEECGWMYETWHPHCDDPHRVKGRINYTIWSDVFVCPECGEEIVFWDQAVTRKTGKVKRTFPCPNCGAKHSKRSLDRAWRTFYDHTLRTVVRQAKRKPILINYSVGKERCEKTPDAEDITLIEKIELEEVPYWFPSSRMPEGSESRRNDDIGITHLHHFYTKRNLWVMAALYSKIKDFSFLLFGFLNTAWHATIMRRFNARGGDRPLSGTLYVPSLPSEANMFDVYAHKIRQLRRFLQVRGHTRGNSLFLISTQSSTRSQMEQDLVDYIFIDPPFGSNLMYSELNFLWESWLQNVTNSQNEAVINKAKNKNLFEYQRLMEVCFRSFYKLLKPGHWMTVEFHNSQNRVWNSIQEALLRAGFVIADVRTLDKKQGSFKHYTSYAAAKQDLIISAYKPNGGLEERFRLHAGTPEGAWDFVRQHLGKLPVVVTRPDGALEVLAERKDYLLFDRMVAFHIQRGATVPLSAAAFYQGLRERFIERDGMFFLPDQTPQYDLARLRADAVAQLALFVSDEKSALQWLRQHLDPDSGGEPQTYQDLQPEFLRQLHQARHEALPELTTLLEQNFIQDAEGRWQVPDPARASDLERLRRKTLLREFNTYTEGRRRLRKFRTEAARAGFADAWQRQDYETIIQVAQRLPTRVLQEEADLLMYYDNAQLLAEES